ncbi:glycosyltransferase family 2 protein [Jannaschia ovalis]|uniref:Glycosyltransferase family 2 protein n=1 Tax=Jannaschia ovalis TaxID=3038773 RepID=A0ABY8LA66_9RHOB|nr:glycosyltransferase family 2 protein [Jannaschia sp. GRR-S6-38]WGH77268.1 glycosyltransferase family 2 protein [Jannaschia sp. GRR-S6-38]
MSLPRLGVVIVTHRAAEVIDACLDSLLAAPGVALRVVVVDNASPDDTVARLRGRVAPAPHQLEVIEAPNGGFAAGVNRGLERLRADPGLARFWILNPDTIVPPKTPARFATHPAPEGWAMIAGRVLYAEEPGGIQIDGGVIDWRTGVTRNLNQHAPADATPPDPARIDFVTGASLVASRAFIECAGPMPEGYFLYYEEVDWAQRRGTMPILHCPEAVVRHVSGASIGSAGARRRASPFSEWFKHRARIAFLRRWRPRSVPGGLAFAVAKAGQHALRGDGAAARATLAGAFGRGPTRAVREEMARAGIDPARL